MPRSVEECVERWTSPHGALVRGHPLDAEMAPKSCILDEVFWDSIGSGAVALPSAGLWRCDLLVSLLSHG